VIARSGGNRVLAGGVVALQAVLLVAFFLAPRRHDWPVPAWLATAGSTAVVAGAAALVFAALNLGRSLTPLPTPASNSTLRTGGLYRFVRHPIYSGLLVLVFGSTAASGSVVRLTLAAALLVLLVRKARWEEDMLRRRYPGYDDYARRTPRFVPRLRPRP
jgi:protein-S-isoprenylcysteine O-methyltransferase Ste14